MKLAKLCSKISICLIVFRGVIEVKKLNIVMSFFLFNDAVKIMHLPAGAPGSLLE